MSEVLVNSFGTGEFADAPQAHPDTTFTQIDQYGHPYQENIDVIGKDDHSQDSLTTPETPSEGFYIPRKGPTPEQAFAAHVAEVRSNGDPVDRVAPSLRIKNALLWGTAPTVLTAELGPVHAGLASAAGVLATGASYLFKRRQEKKAFLNACDHQSNTTFVAQSAVEQFYELHTPSTPANAKPGNENDVELFWYGPCITATEEDRNIYKHLGTMAEMAQKQGIGTMHVSSWVLRQLNRFQEPVLPPTAALSVPDKNVMRDTKKLLIRTSDEHETITTLTPEQWLEVSKQYAEKIDKDPNLFVTLAKKLASVRPEHPLVAIVVKNQADQKASDWEKQQLLKDTLRKQAAGAINRNLGDVEYYANEGAYEARRRGADFTPKTPDEARKKIHFAETGTVRGDLTVDWVTKDGKVNKDLLRSAGLTSEEFCNLLKEPGANPPKAERALEIALLVAANDGHLPKLDQDEAKPKPKDIMLESKVLNPGLHEQLLDVNDKRATFLPQRIGQAFAVGIFAAAAIGASVSIHETMDDARSNAITAAQHYLAKKNHVTIDKIDPQDAEDLVDHKYPIMNAWGNISGAEDFVSEQTSDLVDKAGSLLDSDDDATPSVKQVEDKPPAATSAGEQEVGNSPLNGESYKPQYTVTAEGNISAEGYWAASTSQDLRLGYRDGDKLKMSWLLNDRIYATEFPPKLPEEIPELKGKDLLRVERDLSISDLTHLVEGAFVDKNNRLKPRDPGSLRDAINIPVLEGTKIVAANIDGDETDVYQKVDNTYAVRMEDRTDGHLTYWLAIDDKAPKPKFTGATATTADDASIPTDSPAMTMFMYQQQETGKRNIDLPKGELGNLMQKTITQKWDYKYSPFTDEQKDKWKSLSDFAGDAIKDEEANCNVANTLDVLADPYNRNAVFGYHNDGGNGATKLTGAESHMWNTKDDATPSIHGDGGLGGDSEQSNTGGEDTAQKLQNIAYAVGGLGAGGISLKYGDTILYTLNQRRRRKLLESAKPTEVATALATAEFLAYSGKETVSAGQVQTRAKHYVQKNPDASGQDLASYTQFPGRQTASQLTSIADTLPAEDTFRTSLERSAQLFATGSKAAEADARGPILHHLAGTARNKLRTTISKRLFSRTSK
jgi:hypothetical protein